MKTGVLYAMMAILLCLVSYYTKSEQTMNAALVFAVVSVTMAICGKENKV